MKNQRDNVSVLFGVVITLAFGISLAAGQSTQSGKTADTVEGSRTVAESDCPRGSDDEKLKNCKEGNVENEQKVDKLENNTSLYAKSDSKGVDFDKSAVGLGAKTRPSLIVPERNAESRQDADKPGDADLAKKLSNPVASLISLPFQNNFDFGMGANRDGFRYTLNVQPVIPISLNKDWNLISRTIVPIIYQNNVVADSSQFGLGDTTQSFFFSPNKTEPFVWGLGPVILIPTATSKYLGSQKLAFGPTGLILKQRGKWTIGILASHLWSVAGKSNRADVSLTFGQPFISYTTKTAWTFGANTESTYEWNSKTAGVPINLSVSKLTKFGKRPVSVSVGLKCWARSTPGGPRNCGFRLSFTPLFPK